MLIVILEHLFPFNFHRHAWACFTQTPSMKGLQRLQRWAWHPFSSSLFCVVDAAKLERLPVKEDRPAVQTSIQFFHKQNTETFLQLVLVQIWRSSNPPAEKIFVKKERWRRGREWDQGRHVAAIPATLASVDCRHGQS